MFTLVDHDGGNVLCSYSTEAEALQEDVRADVQRLGRSTTRNLALYGPSGLVAKGSALADRATDGASSPTRRSA